MFDNNGVLAFSSVLLIVLLEASTTVHAQHADSRTSSAPIETSKRNRQGTRAEQAARGEIPFTFADDRLRPDSRKTRRLPSASLPEKKTESGKPMQIGITRVLQPPLSLSGDSFRYEVSGGHVFLMSVSSKGAKAVRVRFSEMNLPEGSRIFIFPLGKDEFYGPFHNSPLPDKTLWTPPVSGAVIVIEFFLPNGQLETTDDYFQVLEIAHNFSGVGEFLLGPPEQPCHNDVGAEYASMASAVGYLEFVNQDGSYICSGTLLSANSNNPAPHLLTANHCFRTQAAAQSLRAYWNYNSGDSPPPGTSFTDGAELLTTTPLSDFTFVRLTGSFPGGLTHSGWEGGDPASNATIVGIHHPKGSHKRISFGFSSTIGSSCSTNLPSACENYIPITWTSGTAEGGSSGSGLFYTASNSGRLIGNLWGGQSGCNSPIN